MTSIFDVTFLSSINRAKYSRSKVVARRHNVPLFRSNLRSASVYASIWRTSLGGAEDTSRIIILRWNKGRQAYFRHMIPLPQKIATKVFLTDLGSISCLLSHFKNLLEYGHYWYPCFKLKRGTLREC